MVMDLPGVAPAEAGFTPGFNSAAPPALLGWEDEERPEEVMPPTSFSPAHQPPLFPFLLLGPRIHLPPCFRLGLSRVAALGFVLPGGHDPPELGACPKAHDTVRRIFARQETPAACLSHIGRGLLILVWCSFAGRFKS